MQAISIIQSNNWQSDFSNAIQQDAIQAVENSKILLFPTLPFLFLPEENPLLSYDYINAKTKNISFNIKTGLLGGMDCPGIDYEVLKNMMQRFAEHAHHLILTLLPHYKDNLQIGRTSFRPIEIAGRKTSYRKDDTRLHVDAFPATPLQGRRILRVFTNINPDGQERVWRVGEPFEEVAKRFLPTVRRPWLGRAALLKALRITKGYSTEYDYTMLQIHNNMKADLHYQKQVTQQEIRFLPGNTWITQTDSVSHAAMSGKHLLEQTFYLPVDAMANPGLSPLRILEKLTGRALI